MDYKDAIDWLYSQLPMFSRVGAAAYKPGLERSFRLADHFGNPQERFKSIHVAGTNGKGSVSNMIAAVLQSQGYKVGLYTSPHLVDFRERIRINGEMIPRREVADFVERWQEGDYKGDRPSFFELTMIMAFDWFERQGVDYAVIEVGMGGRLDSTNIITPILSVITNISKDHTQFLGDTLDKIASEKAGIIKPGVPVVIGEAEGTVERVFREKAFAEGSEIIEAYNLTQDISGITETCTLKGDYQVKNIKTAFTALSELRRVGVAISDNAIKEGLAGVETLTGFKGRWTVLRREPLVICDTGHNEAGLKYNIEQLCRIMNERPDGKLRFVIGFVADKDIEKILQLFPNEAEYYLTQAQIPRALHHRELKERFNKVRKERDENTCKSVEQSYPMVDDAIRSALKEASPCDLIFIGGSTFIVADALASKLQI